MKLEHPFKKEVFLIDAHALCYRSFFAIKGLVTTQGQSTNAVFGFVNTIKKIIREFDPAYMAICFDSAKKTHRQEKFQAYKINRPSMPNELISQIPIIKEVVRAYYWSIFELEGFEADDLIATITQRLRLEGVHSVIVSDDKDMLQLLNDQVSVFSARKETMIDQHSVKEFFGMKGDQIVDFISLAGDKTDNIPGVPGIGEVTARQLLEEFSDLNNVYQHIDQVKSQKVKDLLLTYQKTALLSKELALLDRNVPIDFSLEELKIRTPDYPKLFELYKTLEFRKWADELKVNLPDNRQLTSRPLQIEDVKHLKENVEAIKTMSVWMECSDPLNHRSCSGLYLSVEEKEVVQTFYVPIHEISLAKDLWSNESLIKIAFDVKQLFKVCQDENVSLKGALVDCMLAGYLVSPSFNNADLPALIWQQLSESPSFQHPNIYLSQTLLKLYTVLLKELSEKELLPLFNQIEMPLAYVLFCMESNGVALDLEFLSQLSKEIQKRLDILMKEIFQESQEEFNLNSPKQLAQILFEKMKIPTVKKTKTGYSTDESVLVKLAEKYKIAQLILENRQLSKLKSTYIDALPKLVSARSNRVHAYFKQAGAETGRLSSINPNLQNIPIRTDLGRQIRKAFIPYKEDHVIISADYSQIELRILAHLSDDKQLIKAFDDDEDVHRYTAALIFEVSEKEVSWQMRDTAKRVNFGIIYGMSAFGLAKDLKISQLEAQDFIDKYFLRYPNVKKFMDAQIDLARKQGFVVTILNRRRYIPEINSKDVSVRQFAERQAINTPVQGSAADLIKLAMIRVQTAIEAQRLQSKMIISVHDELVFDVPLKEQETFVPLAKNEMEKALTLCVPIKVSVKSGPNWLDLKSCL